MILSRQYRIDSVGANKQGAFVLLQGTHERIQITLSDVEANDLRGREGQRLKLVLEERSPSSAPPPSSSKVVG